MYINKWKSLEQLKEQALSEVHKAMMSNESQIEIVLSDAFPDRLDKIREACERFRIKEISDDLRFRFKNYHIESRVGCKGALKAIITFEKGPCAMSYPLVWTLNLARKQ